MLRLACNPQNFPAQPRERASYFQDVVRQRMASLRECCDALETMVSAEKWPMPTYAELLHGV